MRKVLSIQKNSQYQSIIKSVLTNKCPMPILFLLYGELGAGKTAFVKQLAKAIGINNMITSPSFLIVKQYKNTKIILTHYDLYRLNDFRQLSEIGFIEELGKKNNIICIEWPNKIKNFDQSIPSNFSGTIIKIYFKYANKINVRNIIIEYEKNKTK